MRATTPCNHQQIHVLMQRPITLKWIMLKVVFSILSHAAICSWKNWFVDGDKWVRRERNVVEVGVRCGEKRGGFSQSAAHHQ